MVGIEDNTKLWAHPRRKNFTQAERIDFTETLLFSSATRTRNGVIKGSFAISDLITKFRITVNTIDEKGRLGFNTSSFQTQKSLYVSFDVPTTLTKSDVMKFDIKVVNLNTFAVTAQLY
jgi:uncharacterized protein YfaS (alpha-2-macroglobulin family)